MSNVKISELPELVSGDVVPLNDVLAIVNAQETKQITVAALLNDYAAIGHNHDEDYAAIGHNHDTAYAAIGHNHDTAYAAATHNHDTAYAAATHNHDTAYAAIGHKHDTDYAAIDHTHDLKSLSDTDISEVDQLQNEDIIKWNHSQQKWTSGQVSVDVETPISVAFRGTENPHIGAYPNQPFKAIDNPYQSVMVVADEAGNLKLLNSLGVNKIAVGFSVVEDGSEPDIEVVSGSETYSVISGDSDSKGSNGLPLRQGFNLPDIGANPAPILISGGSIA